MRKEIAKEIDDMFDEYRETETISYKDAMGFIESTIRKCATKCLEKEETRQMLYKAYLLTERVNKSVEESDSDMVGVPVDLLESIKKDASGEDAEVIPISKAMKEIKSFLGIGVPESGAEQTNAIDQEGTKESTDQDESNDNDWGKDPKW